MYETLVCTVDESRRRRRRRRLRGAARRLICASVIALSEFRFDEWSVSVAAAVPRSTQAQNALLCCSARLLRALIPRAPAPSHPIPFHSIPHSISTIHIHIHLRVHSDSHQFIRVRQRHMLRSHSHSHCSSQQLWRCDAFDVRGRRCT